MEFFPPNKRSQEHFEKSFNDKGLGEVVKLQKAQANQEVKKDLSKIVGDSLAEGKVVKEIINEVKDFSNKNNLAEHEVITIVSGFHFHKI